LGLTSAVFLVLGPWPSHHRRSPIPSSPPCRVPPYSPLACRPVLDSLHLDLLRFCSTGPNPAHLAVTTPTRAPCS
jgi:hypothetical protein